ncbi:uncharacterized protein LOC131940468 [Physella acuta]|uniref:uncharacterized protein LOC131940468 n=1 Tax=Physella acuta TaxID=109671 RepID=UPI0027DADFF4|nr:uncharacterized protein LOC131940468 [Physella acuta]
MVKSTLACGLQECLSKEWMGDNFRDFRVVVDGSEYFCHKFILSACSTFFKTLLGSDFKENKEERVELKNMSKETFDVIINAIYKGVDGLTLDNIISVWQASHLLDIPFLIEECEQFVMENMSLENYIKYYSMAKLLHSENVIKFTIGFMKENFEPFCVTETFLELSFPMLFSFVDDDRLKVKSEDLVLESIINWVSYVKQKPPNLEDSDSETNNTQVTAIEETDEIQNYKSQEKLINGEDNKEIDRKRCLVELLSTARTFLASRSYLENLLIHPLIKSCDEAHEIVYDALLYQWRSVSFPSNFVIPYRNCNGKRNVMAYICNGEIYLFDLNSEGICKLELYIYDFKSFCALASIESTLCVIYSNRNVSECDFSKLTLETHNCERKNIAIINPSKSTTIIGKLCGRFSVQLTSLNGTFVIITNNPVQSHSSQDTFSNWVHLGNEANVTQVAYQDTILIFRDGYEQSYVHCSNLYSRLNQDIKIKGPTKDIISIQKGRKTFILYTNGSLKSIETTGDNKIQFTFIIQLWNNFDWILKGAVYFKKELILFCSAKPTDGKSFLTSVPGLFEKIRAVEIQSQSKVVPLIVPESWCS